MKDSITILAIEADTATVLLSIDGSEYEQQIVIDTADSKEFLTKLQAYGDDYKKQLMAVEAPTVEPLAGLVGTELAL